MVRRVGFGNDPEPEKQPEPKGRTVVTEDPVRPEPVPNARNKSNPLVSAFKLSNMLFSAGKIALLVIIGLRLDNTVGYIFLAIAAFSAAGIVKAFVQFLAKP